MSVKTSQKQSNTTHSHPGVVGTTYLPTGSNSQITVSGATNSTNYITINSLGGGGGGYSTTGYNSNWQAGTTTISSSILAIKALDNGDAIIETNKNTINLDDFYESTLEMMCMIIPDKKLHEEYPTLQDAYDNYIQIRKEREIKIDRELRDAYNQYKSLKAILTIKES